MKIDTNIALVMIFLLLFWQPTSTGLGISPDNATTTGYTVTFALTSFEVVDDYDFFNDGDWHVFIYYNSEELAYSGERTVADGETEYVYLEVTLNVEDSFIVTLRAAENDGTSTELEPNPDYDENHTISKVYLSSEPVDEWVTERDNDGINVYYNYQYYIENNPPQVSSPPSLSYIYGEPITYPGLDTTDEELLRSCQYDFFYEGFFSGDSWMASRCDGTSVSYGPSNYPSQAGSLQYAVQVEDERGETTTVLGDLTLTNLSPTFTTTPSDFLEEPGYHMFDWEVEDYNLAKSTVLVNGTIDGHTDYWPSPDLEYSISERLLLPTEATYNISLVVTDSLESAAMDTVMATIREHTLSGLQLLSPTGGEHFVDEVLVRWDPAIDSWEEPVRYDLEFTQNDGSTWIDLVSNLSNTSYLWDVSALQRGDFYRVRVSAKNSVETITDVSDKVFSLKEPHSITPLLILNPDADEEVSGSVTIDWSEATDNWDHELWYNISLKPSSGSWMDLASALSTTSMTWDTTQVEDGTYQIRVTAYDDYGLSIEEVSGEFYVVNTITTTTPESTTATTPESTTSDTASSEPSSTDQLDSGTNENDQTTHTSQSQTSTPGLVSGFRLSTTLMAVTMALVLSRRKLQSS